MQVPRNLQGLGGIRDFATWKRAVESGLTDLDARIVSIGAGAGARPVARSAASVAAPVSSAGEVIIWIGAGIPEGTLPVTGQVLPAADYPDLAAAVTDLYATGDEPEGTFRLPDLGSPPAGVYVVRT